MGSTSSGSTEAPQTIYLDFRSSSSKKSQSSGDGSDESSGVVTASQATTVPSGDSTATTGESSGVVTFSQEEPAFTYESDGSFTPSTVVNYANQFDNEIFGDVGGQAEDYVYQAYQEVQQSYVAESSALGGSPRAEAPFEIADAYGQVEATLESLNQLGSPTESSLVAPVIDDGVSGSYKQLFGPSGKLTSPILQLQQAGSNLAKKLDQELKQYLDGVGAGLAEDTKEAKKAEGSGSGSGSKKTRKQRTNN
jgi:hypothetical protein